MRTSCAIAILICSSVPVAARAREGAGKPCLAAIGYYIVAKARLQTPESVWVLGASNLPPGSIITTNVCDFLGEGAKTFGRDTTATVGKDGLFSIEVRAEN